MGGESALQMYPHRTKNPPNAENDEHETNASHVNVSSSIPKKSICCTRHKCVWVLRLPGIVAGFPDSPRQSSNSFDDVAEGHRVVSTLGACAKEN